MALNDCIAAFNGHLRAAVTLVERYSPGDEDVRRGSQRIRLALDCLPTSGAEILGPQLLRHGAAIERLDRREAGADAFFLERDYNPDALPGLGEESRAGLGVLIPRLRAFFRGLPGAEQDAVRALIVDLYYTYVEYAIAAAGAP